MSSFIRLIVAALIVGSCGQQSLAAQSEPPPGWINYLAYLESLKTVEFDVFTQLGKSEDSMSVGYAGRLVHFFRSGNTFFKSDPEVDRRGEYCNVIQNGAFYKYNITAQSGSISPDQAYWPLTPLTVMGLQISYYCGDLKGKGIVDIVQNVEHEGEIEAFGPNGFFVKSIYLNRNVDIRGDLYVVLNSEKQNCPSKISIVLRKESELPSPDGALSSISDKSFFFEVTEYEPSNGIYVPVAGYCRSGLLYSTVQASLISVNAVTSVPEVFELPKNTKWSDRRTGELISTFEPSNSKPSVNTDSVAKQTQAKSSVMRLHSEEIDAPWVKNQSLFYLYTACGIAIILAVVLTYKKLTAVFLFGLMLTIASSTC